MIVYVFKLSQRTVALDQHLTEPRAWVRGLC